MNQKELYIQYLEDALSHAKTGEPMKKWQWKISEKSAQWNDLDNILPAPDTILRIKPEPYKWTTFVRVDIFNNTRRAACTAMTGHLTKNDLSNKWMIPEDDILAIHYHEIEIE